MSISINIGNLIRKDNKIFGGSNSSQNNLVSGNITTSKKSSESKSISLKGVLRTSEVNKVSKKKRSPAVIAKKIAQGKIVSSEEQNYLRQIDPKTYRKAETANRLRIKLEDALKSAKSDTAKATAVAQVSAEAMTFAKMDAKDEDSETIITGAELYSAAIQEALSKFASKELNEEMKIYTQIDNNSSVQEEKVGETVNN
jgi:hypothetical protein